MQITLKPFALEGLGPYSVCGVEAGGSGFPMGHINPIESKKKTSFALSTLTEGWKQGERLLLILMSVTEWLDINKTVLKEEKIMSKLICCDELSGYLPSNMSYL